MRELIAAAGAELRYPLPFFNLALRGELVPVIDLAGTLPPAGLRGALHPPLLPGRRVAGV